MSSLSHYNIIGISFEESGDGLGQHYITPETAVGSNLTDVIIVGRAILSVSGCHCTGETCCNSSLKLEGCLVSIFHLLKK